MTNDITAITENTRIISIKAVIHISPCLDGHISADLLSQAQRSMFNKQAKCFLTSERLAFLSFCDFSGPYSVMWQVYKAFAKWNSR